MSDKQHPGRGGDGVKKAKPGRDGKPRWSVRFYWIDERTGEHCERRTTVKAATKTQAMAERQRLLDEAIAGAPQAKQRRKFEDVAAESIANIKRHGTRKTAGSLNRTLCAHFGAWFVDKVTARAVSDYLDGLNGVVVANHRAAMNRVMKHALKHGYITTNPMRDVVLARKETRVEDMAIKPRKALTVDQVVQYFDDLEANEPDLHPLVYTQFMLGCRFSEVSALYRSDLDLESGTVQILRAQYLGVVGPPKGNEARVTGLPLATRALLRAHLDRMANERWPGWELLVFPRPPTSRPRTHNFWCHPTVNDKIKTSFFRLKFAVGCTTHAARHTMVTVASEVSPSEALTRAMTGHKSAAIHHGYQHPETAAVVSLSERVGGAMMSGKTRIGAKTGASKPSGSAEPTKQGEE